MNIAEIDRYCDHFEQRLRKGDSLSAEQFLQENHLPAVGELLAELRKVEQEFRRSQAFAPTGKAQPQVVLQTSGVIRYFGNYELLSEIARGGMGVVYKARQLPLNRIVAVKMILGGTLASPEDIQRFRVEAAAAAQLDHPGIVPIFEVGEHEGHHYFSMGYVEGQSLAKRLIDGPLTPRIAAETMKAVAQAVQYAHAKGVIHRDLKPGNILIDKEGIPRITDFGLAKLVESGSDLTGTGQILGTPSYMPPEQAGGQNDSVGSLSDIYSLGACLYCLLVGRPPFQAATALETVRQVLAQDPVMIRKLDPSIPRDLETICHKCLEKDPANRYRSAVDLADDLTRYLAGEPPRARPLGIVERMTRRVRKLSRLTVFFSVVTALFLLSYAYGYFRLRTLEQNEVDTNFTSTYYGDIARSQKFLESRQYYEMSSLLQKYSATNDLVRRFSSFELSYLQGRYRRPKFKVMDEANRPALGRVDAISPNNSYAVSDGMLHQWLPDGSIRRVGELFVRQDPELYLARELKSVAFSLDSQVLHTLNRKGEVRRWNVVNCTSDSVIDLSTYIARQQSVPYLLPLSDAGSVAVIAGKLIIICSYSGAPKLLECSDWVRAVAAVSKTEVVYTTGNREITRHDFLANKITGTWEVKQEISGLCAINADHIAFTGSGGTGILSLSDGSLSVLANPAHSLHVRFFSGPGLLANYLHESKPPEAAGFRIELWEPTTGSLCNIIAPDLSQLVNTPYEHKRPDLSIGDDGRSISVVQHPSQTHSRWVKQPLDRLSLLILREKARSATFSADSSMIISSPLFEQLSVWDLVTGSKLSGDLEKAWNPMQADYSSGYAFIDAADGGRLIVPGKSIQLDSNGRQTRVVPCPSGSGADNGMGHRKDDLSHDGQRLVLSHSNSIEMWDLAGNKSLWTVEIDSPSCLRFTPDDLYLVVGAKSGQVLDAKSSKTVSKIGVGDFMYDVAFSENGALACLTDNQVLCYSDLKDADPLTIPAGRLRNSTCIALTPDGRRVVVGYDSGEVRCFETRAGALVLTLPSVTKSALNYLEFSRDGRSMLTVFEDGTVAIHYAPGK